MNSTKGYNPKGHNGYNRFFQPPVNFENLFGDLLSGTGIEMEIGKRPKVNIKETEKEFVIELLAPGFEKEEIKVKLDESTLTVSGEKKAETMEEKQVYSRREFSSTSFSRSFTLPENINGEAIKAEFKNGILFVSIPKKEAEKKESKEITIA